MKLLLGLCFSLLPFLALSQEKCGFVPYNKQLAELSPALAQPQGAFEHWMQLRQKELQLLKTQELLQGRQLNARFVIPVVVHVIHRPGEGIGQGRNIPKEQILSQIATLNRDFRAQNTDEINKLPEQFRSLAADTEIEFVLAKQDPEGLPTEGIVRVASSETSWDQSEDLQLKSLSHWPASNYLNLYSAQISGDVIGWAQFPQSDRLSGLEFGEAPEQTDGVVIDYRYLGTGFNAAGGSRGRTATHEIGHYFGLRHIWGDGGCGADDYVNDTPVDDGPHQGCPPDETISVCTNARPMWENYMDYTSDECMALFTPGQRSRMQVVLQYSPRRRDLNNSIAKQEPTVVPNDAGIRSLSLNLSQLCERQFSPVLELRNYGNTQVTQVQVALRVDGTLIRTYTISTNLGYLDTQTLTMDEVEINQPGFHTVSVAIVQTNNQTDNKALNNTASAQVYVPLRSSLPVSQNFQSGLEPFYTVNPDFSYTWELVDVPNGTTAGNKALFLNFYDYLSEGQRDILASPILDLSQTSTAYFSFRYAYAPYPRSEDGLEVWVSTDCSNKLETATRIYAAYGEELATAPTTESPFRPSGASEWAGISLDLSAFAGLDNIQLLLVGYNDFGNNLYVDDIQISPTYSAALNVALTRILQPSPVFGSPTTPVLVEVKNAGTQPIQSLSYRIWVDGVQQQSGTRNGLALASQESSLLELAPLTNLSYKPHLIRVDLHSPNGGIDANVADNRLSRSFVVDSTKSPIPLRESFPLESLSEGLWTTVSPQPGLPAWETVPVTGPQSAQQRQNSAARAQFTGIITEKWLASPILNMSRTQQAGLQFWYYAGGEGPLGLRVLASTDGGLSWPHELLYREGTELRPNNAPAPPSVASWQKEFISLQAFVGQERVRIAFVARGQGSSLVYVDEAEFYLSNEPITVNLPERNGVSLYPNPTRDSFKLHFNLEDPAGEDVTVELFDSRGSLVFSRFYPTTLNQIYLLEVPQLYGGIYLLRIRSTSLDTVKRLVIQR
ncbi:M43 family zinc metalloprotease [Cesiribacter andamanensis]|uniref:Zinc-dependent metalloproteinase lipoprotein, family n=1 Tax=Cesiribacter andamanensis AMV16 TaxID=1279009 RepID=M7MZM2_9BACT|nr:M43 family zinc metalloprotease [Cesiribacter andamanensis]EMR01873.1 zinc-dependent metalloproteinase lipoprotein, family [Cesiribacter andamanensis AMV16]